MLAIIEINPSTKAVLSVKFSTNIAEVKSENIHVINLKEGRLAVNALSMLMNNPQGLIAYSTIPSASINNRPDIGSCIDGLPSVPSNYDIGPFARSLTAEDKKSLSVRPAAHRAGQTSFFGNL